MNAATRGVHVAVLDYLAACGIVGSVPDPEPHIRMCAALGCGEPIRAPLGASPYCAAHGLLVWNFSRWLYSQGVPAGFEGHWLYRDLTSRFDADRAYLDRGWQPEQPGPVR